MRSKDERRMLHTAKLRDVRVGQNSKRANVTTPIVQRLKGPYSKTRINGKDFYTALKTDRQLREEEGT